MNWKAKQSEKKHLVVVSIEDGSINVKYNLSFNLSTHCGLGARSPTTLASAKKSIETDETNIQEVYCLNKRVRRENKNTMGKFIRVYAISLLSIMVLSASLEIVQPVLATDGECWWETTETYGGKKVNMFADNLPKNTDVKFVIYEDDGGWESNADKDPCCGDDYETEIWVKTDGNGRAQTTYTAHYIDDGWFGGNPEFYFFVTAGGNRVSKMSKNELYVKPEIVILIDPKVKVEFAPKGASAEFEAKTKLAHVDPPSEDPVPIHLTLSPNPPGWYAHLDITELTLYEGQNINVTLTATSPASEYDECATYTVNATLGNDYTGPIDDWDPSNNIASVTFIVKRKVGGEVILNDNFGLLVPYVGFASTLLVATATVAFTIKRIRHKKEKP